MTRTMDLQKLNKLCFMICIVCIVLGTVLAVTMVWTDIKDNEFVWNVCLTIGVVFLASALTLSVTRRLRGDTFSVVKKKTNLLFTTITLVILPLLMFALLISSCQLNEDDISRIEKIEFSHKTTIIGYKDEYYNWVLTKEELLPILKNLKRKRHNIKLELVSGSTDAFYYFKNKRYKVHWCNLKQAKVVIYFTFYKSWFALPARYKLEEPYSREFYKLLAKKKQLVKVQPN